MQKGFTLAEVLITIGLIGIVAAMTISSVIENIQNRQNIVHWRKMYSVINQVYEQTIAEGYQPCFANTHKKTCIDALDWARQNTLDQVFIEKMVEKFNVIQATDDATANWAPTAYKKYKTLAGGTIEFYNFNQYKNKFISGELIMFGASHGGPWISVDVDGFERGKNTLGKDLFVIKVYDKHLTPMGADGTFSKAVNGSVCVWSETSGVVNATYIAGRDNGTREAASGACCSNYYLLYDK